MKASNLFSTKKGFAPIVIVLGLLLLLGVSAGGIYFIKSNSKSTTQPDSQFLTKSSPHTTEIITSPSPITTNNKNEDDTILESSIICDSSNNSYVRYISKYVEMCVPVGWNDVSLYKKKQFIQFSNIEKTRKIDVDVVDDSHIYRQDQIDLYKKRQEIKKGKYISYFRSRNNLSDLCGQTWCQAQYVLFDEDKRLEGTLQSVWERSSTNADQDTSAIIFTQFFLDNFKFK